MANWVKRFVKEAIMREELRKYGVAYRLDDGKYYKVVVDAYSENEAIRMVKKNPSDWEIHEFQPSDLMKLTLKAYNYIYVYDSVKKE